MVFKLYPTFQHWIQDCGTLYFYSDPHFDDEEMCYLRKNYIGDEEQVKMINKRIGKKDTIVFLGDIGNPEWISKIRGKKILILGNHDKGASVYEPYFDEIYEGVLTIAKNIILSHEPLVDYKYALNIHGHDHSRWTETFNGLNVCAELINYTPISLKDIIKSGKLGKSIDIHREIIDNANERKMGVE